MGKIGGQSTKIYCHCGKQAAQLSLSLPAAALIGALNASAADAADTESRRTAAIILNNDNIDTFLQQGESGVAWLAGADKNESKQSRDYAVTEFSTQETLGLNRADIRLTVDTRQNFTDSPVLLLSDKLQINQGRLIILAESPDIRSYADESDAADENMAEPKIGLGFSDSAESFAEIPQFIQTGGSVAIQAKDSSFGIVGGNLYRLQGGEFSVATEDTATGLQISYSDALGQHNGDDSFFRQTGGRLHFSAKDNSISLESNQSVEIAGGALQINTADGAKGIRLLDADTAFRQSGGAVAIKAEGGSIGLETGKMQLSGGRLRLQSSGAAKAVSITKALHEDGAISGGEFLFDGGIMEIAPTGGNAENYALYGEENSHARFGKDSLLRLAPQINIGSGAAAGMISFGAVRIEAGAKLDRSAGNVTGSYRLVKSAPIAVNFLESRETPIDGVFTETTAGQQKLFYDYRAELSADSRHYQLRLAPKRKTGLDNSAALRVSDISSGNGRRAAAAMEKILPNQVTDTDIAADTAYGRAARFYDALYNSDSGAEAQVKNRLNRMTPQQTTRLPAISLWIQENFADNLRQSVRQVLAPDSAFDETTVKKAANAAAKSGRDSEIIWLNPAGNHGKYRGQNHNFADLAADYGGFNFGGAARHNQAAFGLSAGFTSGRLRGGHDYRADMRHFLFGGSLAYAWPRGKNFRPLLDINLSYGSGRFKQKRRDSFDSVNHGRLRHNSLLAGAMLTESYPLPRYNLRLSPQIGLDYGIIRQSAYQESGGALPLSAKGASFNALRPKIGGMIAWQAAEQLQVKTRLYYRYDILDTNINLDAHLRDASALAWKTKGENSRRASLAAGLNLSYQLFPAFMLSGVYHIAAQGKRTAQQFSAAAVAKF